MSNEYPAGTVAEVTYLGKRYRAIRTGVQSNPGWEIAVQDARLWSSDRSGYITDVRPLVVLDPNVVSYAATALEGSSDNGDRYCAKQLRDALPKPPRIPEPGLWGVVEAGYPAGERRRHFCRMDTDSERWLGAAQWMRWEALIDPVLVRPGIEDAT